MSHRISAVPFLARFASPRSSHGQLAGWYSSERAMWMLETADGPQPAIECSGQALELSTKTEVKEESDDAIEWDLLTKTLVLEEKDDEDRPIGVDVY